MAKDQPMNEFRLEVRLAQAMTVLRQAGDAIDGLIAVGAQRGVRASDVTMTIRANIADTLKTEAGSQLTCTEKHIADESLQDAMRERYAPRGLKVIGHGQTWIMVDLYLSESKKLMTDRAQRARLVAARARARGNLVKWQKFNAVARAYEISLESLGDFDVPF